MCPAVLPTATPTPSISRSRSGSKSPLPTVISPSFAEPSPRPAADSIPPWVQPDLNRIMRVEHLPGAFAARSISLIDLPAGAIFARINTPTPAKCAYTSVQASRTLHIELNSDLVYINHSCRPTLVFDMARWEVRVNPDLEGGLRAGDELTFFYPSTEWDMAQPFDCLCKQKECRGRISGAKDMPGEVMRQYWLNPHIMELLQENRVSLKNGTCQCQH